MKNQLRTYTTKPQQIQALTWDQEQSTLSALQAAGLNDRNSNYMKVGGKIHLWVKTPDGSTEVEPGNYIARDDKGNFYLCKPGQFHETHELVDWEKDRDGDMWPEYETEAKCRLCGCTDSAACAGGCRWASEEEIIAAGLEPMNGDVCTHCLPEPEEES